MIGTELPHALCKISRTFNTVRYSGSRLNDSGYSARGLTSVAATRYEAGNILREYRRDVWANSALNLPRCLRSEATLGAGLRPLFILPDSRRVGDFVASASDPQLLWPTTAGGHSPYL
jgi:hypothetical protein